MKVQCSKCGKDFEQIDYVALANAIMQAPNVCEACEGKDSPADTSAH